MNPRQKRIVLVMVALTGLVFVAVVIASLGRSDGDSDAIGETTTSITESTSSTTESATATSTPSTTAPEASSSTTTSTTAATTTTTTPTPAPPTVVLRPDGLGRASDSGNDMMAAFGSEAETAIAAITAALGPPDEDTGWIPSFSGFGTCPGEEVRVVRWATMWAYMTDGSTEWRDDGVPHFFSYLNSVFASETASLGLLTDDGVGLGDTVKALRDAYGSRVEIMYEEFYDGYVFNIDVAAPGQLWGGLTGGDDDDLITSIDGGTGCGE